MYSTAHVTWEQGRLVKINKHDAREVARAHAAIELLYRVDANSRKAPLHVTRRNKRFRELETVLAFNHRGSVLSDDDAGRDDLMIVACHLLMMQRKNPVAAFLAWPSKGHRGPASRGLRT